MSNQNIISNKFDLNWSTTFSYIMLNDIKLSIIMLNDIMMSIIMLSVTMLNVIILNAIMLSVVAPSITTVKCFILLSLRVKSNLRNARDEEIVATFKIVDRFIVWGPTSTIETTRPAHLAASLI